MNISIVIPNYNSAESLLKNLPQVLKTGADEIVIVDDGSTDGSLEQIKNEKRGDRAFGKRSLLSLREIKIIENKKNLGFSSAVNRGVKEASGEIVVLLNTDVSPEQDFLKPLISHFADPQVFAVGCLDKSVEDGKVVLRGRGVGEWKRGFLVHRRGEIDKTDTLWVAGGSGAFRRNLWKKFGGFDPLYNPFYWEDIDLSYRAQKSGYKILFEPKSQVLHEHEQGVIRRNFSPFYIKTIAYRNQFFFVWKNITDINLLLNHILWLPYHLVRMLLFFDFAFWLGFTLAILNLPKVIRSRWQVCRLFVKNDKKIITSFYE